MDPVHLGKCNSRHLIWNIFPHFGHTSFALRVDGHRQQAAIRLLLSGRMWISKSVKLRRRRFRAKGRAGPVALQALQTMLRLNDACDVGPRSGMSSQCLSSMGWTDQLPSCRASRAGSTDVVCATRPRTFAVSLITTYTTGFWWHVLGSLREYARLCILCFFF